MTRLVALDKPLHWPSIGACLMELALRRWRTEHWRVQRHTHRVSQTPGLLARIDRRKHVVHVYPHNGRVPAEKTGLHELWHILFELGGTQAEEEVCHFLEDMVWAGLDSKHHHALQRIFGSPRRSV